MFAINNNDFQILNKCKEFSNYIDNILENVPRKDKFYKDKIRDILSNIMEYIFKCSYADSKERLEYYYINIKSDIAYFDFMIERLFVLKYINEKNIERVAYKIVEINKMVTAWLNGK